MRQTGVRIAMGKYKFLTPVVVLCEKYGAEDITFDSTYAECVLSVIWQTTDITCTYGVAVNYT